MNDIRDFIKIADAFGSEARKLAEAPGDTLQSMGINPADVGGTRVPARVPPRPTGSGRNVRGGQVQWDSKYGQTHNPDGSLKTSDTPPQAQTTTPQQPQAPGSDTNPGRPGGEAGERPSRTSPEQPQAPGPDTDPQADTTAPSQPQVTAPDTPVIPADPDTPTGPGTGQIIGDPMGTGQGGGTGDESGSPQADAPEAPAQDAPADTNTSGSPTPTDVQDRTRGRGTPADTNTSGSPTPTDVQDRTRGGEADSADNATTGQDDAQAAQGDALAGRLDTTTPSLLDAYNNGGRQAMDSVRDLQTGLSRLGFDPNGIDGKYGRGTYAAVQEFQRQHGLQVDGEAGPTTMAKLQELLGSAQSPQTGGQQGATQPGDAGDGTRGGEAPQTDAELDNDAVDTGGEPTAGTGDDGSDTEEPGDADMPLRPEEMDRFQELLDRLEAEPASESTDVSMRSLLSLIESLTEAAGDLTPEEYRELRALYTRLERMDDPRAKELANRYRRIPGMQQHSGRGAPPTGAEVDADSGSNSNIPDDGNRGGQQPNNLGPDGQYDGDDLGNAPTAPRISDEKIVQVTDNGASLGNWNVKKTKEKYGTYIDIPDRKEPGYVIRAYGPEKNLKRYIKDKKLKDVEIQGGQDFSGQPDAERDGRERGVQTASKEFDMKKFIKESKELDECGPEMSMPRQEGNPVTMSVTLNASGEENVQDLIRMMQLAGAKDAAPVADMHVGPKDQHDDMVSMMQMMDGPDESVEEDWDNSPNEDYKDHKHMTKDLSGGLNREKKAYAKAQDGDNAMAVESIKSQLLQALEETGYNKK